MIRTLLLAGAALCWSGLPSLASTLDFLPIAREVRADGASRKVVYFRSAHLGLGRLSVVEYAPPWPLTGNHDVACMMVPGKNATVYLCAFEMVDPFSLADESSVVEWVTGKVPADATRVKVEKIERNPVQLNNNPTIEVTVSFALYGRALQSSFFLCQRRGEHPEEIFAFQVAASPTDFKEVHRHFQASLYSIVGF